MEVLTSEPATRERELNKATARVLQVLSAFASEASGFGVTELARALGMTKNMTYRALATLIEQGYLMRELDGARYQLGYRVLELQNPQIQEPDFRALSAPYLLRLHMITGESAGLVVRAGDLCVVVEGLETRKPGVWRVRAGAVFPLFGTAAGRAILAHDDDAAIETYLARQAPMHDPRSGLLLDPGTLKEEIAQIRAQGYAQVERATPPEMVSVAFPVFDIDGRLHGAMSLGGPRARFAAELDRQMPALREVVAELNHRTRLFPADDAGAELH